MLKEIIRTTITPLIITTRSYSLRETWQNTKEPLFRIAQRVNKKTGEYLAEGIDIAQQTQYGKATSGGVKETFLSSKERQRVNNNFKDGGYGSLQNKGKMVESEQCRADDGL